MKHYLSIAAALTVSAMAAFAQTEAGGVLVNHPELLRNERLMTVEMEVVLSGLDVSSNRVAVYTPIIVNGKDTAAFTPFALYGRNRWYYYCLLYTSDAADE